MVQPHVIKDYIPSPTSQLNNVLMSTTRKGEASCLSAPVMVNRGVLQLRIWARGGCPSNEKNDNHSKHQSDQMLSTNNGLYTLDVQQINDRKMQNIWMWYVRIRTLYNVCDKNLWQRNRKNKSQKCFPKTLWRFWEQRGRVSLPQRNRAETWLDIFWSAFVCSANVWVNQPYSKKGAAWYLHSVIKYSKLYTYIFHV